MQFSILEVIEAFDFASCFAYDELLEGDTFYSLIALLLKGEVFEGIFGTAKSVDSVGDTNVDSRSDLIGGPVLENKFIKGFSKKLLTRGNLVSGISRLGEIMCLH